MRSRCYRCNAPLGTGDIDGLCLRCRNVQESRRIDVNKLIADNAALRAEVEGLRRKRQIIQEELDKQFDATIEKIPIVEPLYRDENGVPVFPGGEDE